MSLNNGVLSKLFCYNIDEKKMSIQEKVYQFPARATVYVEFVCSPHICVGLLRGLVPHPKHVHVR